MIVCIHYLTSVRDSDSGKVVYYNCCFIPGCGGEINVLKKWSSNDSGGLGFLRYNAKISQDLCEVMENNSPLPR